MKELSLHILDIVNNSLSAEASTVLIHLAEDEEFLTLRFVDDGLGMDAEFAARVTDPFTTTRTTRKMGMGIPLLKMAAELTGGYFELNSLKGRGTILTAAFGLRHIDRPPLGDMAATLVTLIQGAPHVNFYYVHQNSFNTCILNTEELRETLEDVPLDSAPVLAWIQSYLEENDFKDEYYVH